MPEAGIRVAETTKTTGTGPYALEGKKYGCQTFVDGIGGTKVAFYTCQDVDVPAKTGNWEVGYGTITDSAPDTLTRTVLASSNGGSPVNWGDGTRDIFCSLVNSGFVIGENNLADIGSASAARSNLGLGTAAVKNEGTGNQLDADKVDGKEASEFVQNTGAQTVAGDKEFQDDVTFEGDVNVEATIDLNATATGRLILPVGADKYGTV